MADTTSGVSGVLLRCVNASGRSAAELARMLDWEEKRVRQLKRGEVKAMRLETLDKLADVFGLVLVRRPVRIKGAKGGVR